MIKFDCPICSGTVEVDPEWAGQQRTCPHCRTALTVPSHSGAQQATEARMSSPLEQASSSAPAAKQGYSPEVDTGTAKKTSVGAILALVFGLIGLFPLAIILGHIARSQIKNDPTQSGKGMALAGLILGYLSLVLLIVSLTFAVPMWSTTVSRAKENRQMQRAVGVSKALRVWSFDNNDAYPRELDELVEDGLEAELIKFHRIDTGEPVPWLYFYNNNANSRASEVLLASPVAHKGKRIVVFADSSGRILPEEEFLRLTNGKERSP